VRIVIAEDLPLLREGLIRILRANSFEVVEAVDNGPALIRSLTTHRPDVAIVDVRLPPTFTDEGLRSAIEARRQIPGLPIMVLSQYVEQIYARELMSDRAGAVGYLLKDRVIDVEEFLEGLRRVAAGGTVFDPQVVSQLMVRRRRDDPLAQLTPREREVLELMAEGRSNPAIGRQLVVSDGAVEKHIRSIFAKLGLYADAGDQHRRVLAVLTYLRT
jgi:DNA-binding NarL/FixJ family response regulator